MKNHPLREIIPLSYGDCFTIFSRKKSGFDFPLHCHEEYELNFIKNGQGVKRVVGNNISEIGEYDLVLIGPNLQHAWFTHNFKGDQLEEVTIQFNKFFLDAQFLRLNQLSFIRSMLEKSKQGILFSREASLKVAEKVFVLNTYKGFDSVIMLLSILHDLSVSSGMTLLSDSSFTMNESYSYNSRRIEKTMEYMNKHFDKQISLTEVAREANMTQAAFSRFFKMKTGKNYIDSLNEIRLGHAARLLIDTNHSIAEIAYHCGFNNISNFNRIFKKKKGATPKEFKESYTYGLRVIV